MIIFTNKCGNNMVITFLNREIIDFSRLLFQLIRNYTKIYVPHEDPSLLYLNVDKTSPTEQKSNAASHTSSRCCCAHIANGLSSHQSWWAGFSSQGGAMGVGRPASEGAHNHADVTFLLPLVFKGLLAYSTPT